MARSRQLKPDFFLNEELAALPALTRLAFQGLWTLADREGRLEDRPARIKAQLFPYHEADMAAMLTELSPLWITRYIVDNSAFIQIVNFKKHQHIHPDEKQSVIPQQLVIPGDPRRSPAIMPCSSSSSPSSSPSSKQPQTPSAVDRLIDGIKTTIPIEFSIWRFPRGFNKRYACVHITSVPVDECVKLLNTPRLGKQIRAALEWRIAQKQSECAK